MLLVNIPYMEHMGSGSNVVTIDGPDDWKLQFHPRHGPGVPHFMNHLCLCQTMVDIPIKKGMVHDGPTLIICYSLLNIDYLE